MTSSTLEPIIARHDTKPVLERGQIVVTWPRRPFLFARRVHYTIRLKTPGRLNVGLAVAIGDSPLALRLDAHVRCDSERDAERFVEAVQDRFPPDDAIADWGARRCAEIVSGYTGWISRFADAVRSCEAALKDGFKSEFGLHADDLRLIPDRLDEVVAPRFKDIRLSGVRLKSSTLRQDLVIDRIHCLVLPETDPAWINAALRVADQHRLLSDVQECARAVFRRHTYDEVYRDLDRGIQDELLVAVTERVRRYGLRVSQCMLRTDGPMEAPATLYLTDDITLELANAESVTVTYSVYVTRREGAPERGAESLRASIADLLRAHIPDEREVNGIQDWAFSDHLAILLDPVGYDHENAVLRVARLGGAAERLERDVSAVLTGGAMVQVTVFTRVRAPRDTPIDVPRIEQDIDAVVKRLAASTASLSDLEAADWGRHIDAELAARGLTAVDTLALCRTEEDAMRRFVDGRNAATTRMAAALSAEVSDEQLRTQYDRYLAVLKEYSQAPPGTSADLLDDYRRSLEDQERELDRTLRRLKAPQPAPRPSQAQLPGEAATPGSDT